MNIDELRQEIQNDEGRVNSVYLDHLNLPTVGIGHLIKESDPEHGLPVGTVIDDERVNELFDQDIKVTLSECEQLYGNFNDLPEEVQKILANMMFNLGRPRLSKFIRMRENVNKRDWKSAAAEMRSSRWYDQVTKRAERLCERMEAIST